MLSSGCNLKAVIVEGGYSVCGLRGNREGGTSSKAVGHLWLCDSTGAESEQDGCQLCVSAAHLSCLTPASSVQPWEQT